MTSIDVIVNNVNEYKIPVVIVTGNKGKTSEFASILGFSFDVTNQSYDLTEIQGFPSDVAIAKAKEAVKIFGKAVVIEDTSLYLKEMGLATGTLVKWLGMSDDPNEKESAKLQCKRLYEMSQGFADKTLIARCTIAYCEPEKEPMLFIGEAIGEICSPEEGAGEYGFGWDAIMKDSVTGKSWAQLTNEEKNKISHRRDAIDKFTLYFKNKMFQRVAHNFHLECLNYAYEHGCHWDENTCRIAAELDIKHENEWKCTLAAEIERIRTEIAQGTSSLQKKSVVPFFRNQLCSIQ
ncbi:HAM1 NTPase [Bodo saltans virus]|uniref:HAM1 NTPase n=1 Tax=Bodo saltans virus TaxID=2024608 RepID=A0A2H4UUV7_9VIRU|nr:HAM1 NTPase [Bodo saltans virus]ATZ80708.1 HAM1 NTPase [Bodo saltans virus]